MCGLGLCLIGVVSP